MKVVFPTCCGVDVHKTFVVATIITTPADSLQPHYQKKRFSTFNSDLNRFADWLLEHNCLDVCMESTGKYWVPVFNILEKRGIRIVVANPTTGAYIGAICWGVILVCIVCRAFSNKCPHCGKLKQTSGKYCSYCGKEIN